MRFHIMTFSLFLGACAGGDGSDECGEFGCPAPTMVLPGESSGYGSGEEAGSDGGSHLTSGASPFCNSADNTCSGDQALRYCDEDTQELRTIDCRGVCGADRESLGCGLGDDGAVCFCGPEGSGEDTSAGPDATTGGDETTADDAGAESSTGGESETDGDDLCTDPDFPTYCPGQHGVPASCWTEGTDCSTIVECPNDTGACNKGYAVDCTEYACVEVPKGLETTNALCSNGLDDDGSGYADCADLSCYNQNVTVCNAESTDLECSNGQDDDNDGYTDCNDVACQMSPAVTVCGVQERTVEACGNNLDDDGDSLTDCDDWGCWGPYAQAACI